MSIHALLTKMAKNLVTNEEYVLFCKETKRPLGKTQDGNPRPRQPVVYVSWFDAVDYCVWLTTKTGLPWRLPTEDELKAEEALIPASADFSQWPLKELPDVGMHPETTSQAGINDLLGVVYQWTMRPEDVVKYYEAYDKWRDENPALMDELAKKREEERLAEARQNAEGADFLRDNYSEEILKHGFELPETESYFGQHADLVEAFVKTVEAERQAAAGLPMDSVEVEDPEAGTLNEFICEVDYVSKDHILRNDPMAEMNGAFNHDMRSESPGHVWDVLGALIEGGDSPDDPSIPVPVEGLAELTHEGGNPEESSALGITRPMTHSDRAFLDAFSEANGAVAGKKVTRRAVK